MKLAIYLVLISLIVPNLSFAGPDTKTDSDLFRKFPDDPKESVSLNQMALMGVDITVVAGAGFSGWFVGTCISDIEKESIRLARYEAKAFQPALYEKVAYGFGRGLKILGKLGVGYGILQAGSRPVLVMLGKDPGFQPLAKIGVHAFKQIGTAVKLTEKSSPIPERLVDPATVAEARR